MNAEVTIVIPSLLRESLAETIRSITAQEVKTDIVIVTGNNPPAQRNQGADKATSKYILFTDDDVTLQRGCITRLIQTMEEENLDVVFPALRGGFASTPAFVSAGAGIFCRREVFKVVRWDESILLGDDLDWGWTMMDEGFKWRYDDRAVIYHIGHPRATNSWAAHAKIDCDKILERKHPIRYAWLKTHSSSVLEVSG